MDNIRLTKTKDNNKTNQINQNVSWRGGLRSRADDGFAQDESSNDHHHDGRCGWHATSSSTSTLRARDYPAYSGIGLVVSAPKPARRPWYYYTKRMVLVDADGKPVEWSLLRPDLPVRYEYVRDGDRMVVSRVVVTKPLATFEKRETTTTTTTTP
jgi:hypothetical protein